MNYIGGKWRQGPAIAKVVATAVHNTGAAAYYEPFCGALGAAVRVITKLGRKPGMRFYLSDKSKAVVTMLQALVDGWVPPKAVTKEMHE